MEPHDPERDLTTEEIRELVRLTEPILPGEVSVMDQQTAALRDAVDALLAGEAPLGDSYLHAMADMGGRLALAAINLINNTDHPDKSLDSATAVIAAELLRRVLAGEIKQ